MLFITDEAKKNIRLLHHLEFYILCPDDRRFPVADLCKEYEKKPDGIFMRTFENRLVVIVQAVFPSTKQIVYWNQAFYLSTGTSINSYYGRKGSNDTRANTWMPFHGLVIQGKGHGSLNKFDYDLSTMEATPSDTHKMLNNFYFVKVAHLNNSDINKTNSYRKMNNIKNHLNQTTLAKMQYFEETYANFLPEGKFQDWLGKGSLYSRFQCLSYLLASHEMGGNAFNYPPPPSNTEKPMNDMTAMHLGRVNNHTAAIRSILPDLSLGPFEKVFPELYKRLAVPSPPQPCFADAIKTTAIYKPNEINAFIDRHGAIGRMNFFRSNGIQDMPVPNLSISAVPFTNLSYEASLEEYDLLLNAYVSYYFIRLRMGMVGKAKFTEAMRASMSDIIRMRNSTFEERNTIVAPDDEGVTFTLAEKEMKHKNYLGGRKSRRNRRHKVQKLTRKQ
jgi:hypothetical protein